MEQVHFVSLGLSKFEPIYANYMKTFHNLIII